MQKNIKNKQKRSKKKKKFQRDSNSQDHAPKADTQPLDHQGSKLLVYMMAKTIYKSKILRSLQILSRNNFIKFQRKYYCDTNNLYVFLKLSLSAISYNH